MVDLIPFIKKFLNTKSRPLDEQIDDVLDAVGGSSEGALTAQAIGSWVVASSQNWTVPFDGVYRLVSVGAGASGDKSVVQAKSGGTVVCILRCVKNNVLNINAGSLQDTTILMDEKTAIRAAAGSSGDDVGGIISQNVIESSGNQLLSSAIYDKGWGDVTCFIPELCSHNEVSDAYYKAVGFANLIVHSGKGFLGYIGNSAYDATESRTNYITAPVGYGAGGAYVNRTSTSSDGIFTYGNPGCCIITLLKKE